jgi:hypothetical protein
MHGIPPKRRGDFLALWGLGTLFGETIKVDMPYTREHGVLRILIGCLDYTRIPDRTNVLTVDGFYELFSKWRHQKEMRRWRRPLWIIMVLQIMTRIRVIMLRTVRIMKLVKRMVQILLWLRI